MRNSLFFIPLKGEAHTHNFSVNIRIININLTQIFGGGEGGKCGKCGEIEGEKVWIELSTYTYTV
ncbi:MAG: hypothetical protein SWX82_34155 [Cyanobacteriota bacterium]|nr:hypothetical protein [Cyanobacteriota bacterium]